MEFQQGNARRAVEAALWHEAKRERSLLAATLSAQHHFDSRMPQKDSNVISSTTNYSDKHGKDPRNSDTQSNDNGPAGGRNLTAGAVIKLIGLLLLALQYFRYTHFESDSTIPHISRLSNGTHEYERTVILVSIDGMRCVSIWYPTIPQLLSYPSQGRIP